MQADPKVKLARASLPVTANRIYFDTASVGPVTTIFSEALARCMAEDVRLGRALLPRFERIESARDQIRSELAILLGAEPQEIVLTQGTADSVRTLLERIDWRAGDEILTTQVEFPRCRDKIDAIERSAGVAVRVADVPADAGRDIGWLEQAVSPQTRLIVCSGVVFTTGQRLPIDQIAEFAAARGILTLVDGAQLVGANELDLRRTAVDFVAMPLQKWLCGPEGLGALYIRNSQVPGGDNVVQSWPILEATAEQLRWMRETLGWSWIHARTVALSDLAFARAQEIAYGELVTPPDHAGLIALTFPEGESTAVVDKLESRGIFVRHRPELDLIRISTAYFIEEEEIDRFMTALQ